MSYTIPQLPLQKDLDTKEILKKLTKAHQALAELKGVAAIIPNQNILLNTLSLQEAKDSSEIENIITTQDELYQSDEAALSFASLAAKEVYNYSAALKNGFEEIKRTELLTNNCVLEIQSRLEENNAGFRKLIGTALKNDRTGETIYTPPQNVVEIESLMSNLEKFINDDSLSDLDSLVKMAIIHHQFESIHPFYDGNGRTGRIINVLYLVKQKLLNSPTLYLSRYINQNKANYYKLLQKVRDADAWQEWVLFILEAVEKTSHQTTALIHGMKNLMQGHKEKMRSELPKIYSQDLINLIFSHPYTKIDFVVKEIGVTRLTATRYLNELVRIGLMKKEKKGRENYYINIDFFKLLGGVIVE